MIHLPDPPEGSAISVKPIAEGVRLSWKPRRQRRAFLWATFYLAAGGAGLWLAWTCLRLAFSVPRHAIGEFLFVVVSGVILFGLAIALFLRQRQLALETVVFTSDGLSHTGAWSPAKAEGTFAASDHWLLPFKGPNVREILRKREATIIERAEVTSIRLMGRGRFEHIAVETPTRHVDIGKHVGHADRAWLLDVLRRWRDAP